VVVRPFSTSSERDARVPHSLHYALPDERTVAFI